MAEGEYREVLLTMKTPDPKALANLDLVVVNKGDGTFTIIKDRYGRSGGPFPWDSLPSRVKRALQP